MEQMIVELQIAIAKELIIDGLVEFGWCRMCKERLIS